MLYPGQTGVRCVPNVPGGTERRRDGSGAVDSDRTGLIDPPEDWRATDLPAAQRLLRSFRSLLLPPWCRCRDSTRAIIARSVWLVCYLGLKAPIHVPKMFLGVWLPTWGAVSSRFPKDTSCAETRHMTYWSSKLVTLTGSHAYCKSDSISEKA